MTVLELAMRWAKPPRILIVENDRAVGREVVNLLSRYECEVELAMTVAQAVSAVECRTYALVFVDVSLPDGSGLDVIKALKAHAPSTPVLLEVSGAELPEEALECTPLTVVRKPHDITAQQLQNTLGMFKVRAVPRQEVAA